METREIPRESWIRVPGRLLPASRGWLVDVEVLGAVGAQTERGSVLSRGSSEHGGRRIAVTLGRASGRLSDNPEPVPPARPGRGGADLSLQIESSAGG